MQDPKEIAYELNARSASKVERDGTIIDPKLVYKIASLAERELKRVRAHLTENGTRVLREVRKQS